LLTDAVIRAVHASGVVCDLAIKMNSSPELIASVDFKIVSRSFIPFLSLPQREQKRHNPDV
jgi:hypothetical protein